MAKVKARQKKQVKVIKSPFKNYWTKSNYYIFGAGLLITILGFILMSQSPWDNSLSLSVSPIVLLIAYIIVFPFAIMYNKNKSKSDKDAPSES